MDEVYCPTKWRQWGRSRTCCRDLEELEKVALVITALTHRVAENGWMDKQAIEWVETGSLSWLSGQTMTNMGIVLVL